MPQRIAGEIPIRRNVGMFILNIWHISRKKLELISVSIHEINYFVTYNDI